MRDTKLVRFLKVFAWLMTVILLLIMFLQQHSLYAATYLNVTVTHSCSLQSNLGVFYSVKFNGGDNYSNVKLHLEKQVFSDSSSNYTWEEYDLTDYTIKDGCYVFAFNGVSPVEMNNTLKATVHATKGSSTYFSETDTFTVKDYITGVLKDHQNGTTDTDKKLRTLCVDLLNYGANAQTYFNINTGSLPNSGLTTTQRSYASALPTSFASCYSYKALSGSSCNIDNFLMADNYNAYINAYLKFSNTPSADTVMEVSYKASTGASKKITIPSSDFVYDNSIGYYVASITDIGSPDFKAPLTVVVKKGSTAISGTYVTSVETCMGTIYANASTSLKNLLKYAMALGNSSNAYFCKEDPVTPVVPTTVVTPIPTTPIITGDYVTYKQFGAKGDGVTDDYAAIIKTHEEANKLGLPVKADPGATYYVAHMDPNNPKGALIKTNTDWGDATFIIDDSVMTLTNGKCAEMNCVLFTVEPSVPRQKKWINPKFNTFLGIDPNLGAYPEYDGTPASNSVEIASTLTNKVFGKDTTQFSGTFGEKALYALKTESYKRWGRNGSATASGDTRPQEEIVIVNKDGSIDGVSKLQWDWKDISSIEKYTIDETTLFVTGGTFITVVNVLPTREYCRRGISIIRSNVVMSNVKHYLTGEEAQYTETSTVGDKRYPRLGAPYQGFFRLDHCAYVTLKDCVFSDHLCVYGMTNANGTPNNVNKTAPYDYYAEYAAAITLDHCTCATDIMDKSRWGTMGTNYCKDITVQNNCSINRVDAHKGTYDLTVKDSEIGCWGICAVGFGDMVIENVTGHSDYFISLRRDYGSAWYGDIYVKNCTWDIGTDYVPEFILCNYDPMYMYGYDQIKEGNKTYYCSMPTTVNIDGLTVNASKLNSSNGGAVFYRYGLQIFSPVFMGVSQEIDDAFLNDATKYKYPLLVTKEVNVKNLTIIKSEEFKNKNFGFGEVSIRNGLLDSVHDEYFFANTKFNYDSSSTVIRSGS